MKKIIFTFITIFAVTVVYSQETETIETENEWKHYTDSIESTLKYEYGAIELENGVARLVIPVGYKFLNAQQAQFVLADIYGNPEDESVLGLIIPENQSIFFEDAGYVFEVYYDEIGYVKDGDADHINYNDLLKNLQKETDGANPKRIEAGYNPITLVGWASKPYYDKNKKILHWAKELKFGDAEVNTLNYNVRFLGRKGVLVLNAIADMPALPVVQEDLPKILDIVQFNAGYKYKDFDPSIDEVAKWTIGALVAGKVLTKVGIGALLLKFWKVIVLAVSAFFGGFGKKLFGKKKKIKVSGV